jgi:hypothetical protein
MINSIFFRELRAACRDVVEKWAKQNDLLVDLNSLNLVPLSKGHWEGLFDAMTLGREFRQITVDALEDSRGIVVVRACNMNFCKEVNLRVVLWKVSELRDARPKSQGQTVSDAVYENWKRDQDPLFPVISALKSQVSTQVGARAKNIRQAYDLLISASEWPAEGEKGNS